jgi:hypothetical protein
MTQRGAGTRRRLRRPRAKLLQARRDVRPCRRDTRRDSGRDGGSHQCCGGAPEPMTNQVTSPSVVEAVHAPGGEGVSARRLPNRARFGIDTGWCRPDAPRLTRAVPANLLPRSARRHAGRRARCGGQGWVVRVPPQRVAHQWRGRRLRHRRATSRARVAFVRAVEWRARRGVDTTRPRRSPRCLRGRGHPRRCPVASGYPTVGRGRAVEAGRPFRRGSSDRDRPAASFLSARLACAHVVA